MTTQQYVSVSFTWLLAFSAAVYPHASLVRNLPLHGSGLTQWHSGMDTGASAGSFAFVPSVTTAFPCKEPPCQVGLLPVF